MPGSLTVATGRRRGRCGACGSLAPLTRRPRDGRIAYVCSPCRDALDDGDLKAARQVDKAVKVYRAYAAGTVTA